MTTPHTIENEKKLKEWWAVYCFSGYSFFRNEKDAKTEAKNNKTDIIHVVEAKAFQESQEKLRIAVQREMELMQIAHRLSDYVRHARNCLNKFEPCSCGLQEIRNIFAKIAGMK